MFSLQKNSQTISISPSIVVFGVLFLLSLYFFYAIRSILLLLFLAFLLMVALNAVVVKLQTKLHLPRLASIAITYIVLIVALIAAVVFLLPPLLSELYVMVKGQNFPWLQDQVSHLSLTVSELSSVVQQLGSSAGAVWSAVMTTFSGIFSVFTILVMSFYLVLDRNNLHKRIWWFTTDPDLIKKADDFINALEVQLGGWVRGELILMFSVGLATYVGLSLLSVPYALPLGLLAGALEILPSLGPTLSTIPGVLIALITMSPVMAGIVLLLYILVQQFENSFLVPKIMKDNVDVSPLVSILSILIGFKLGGVLMGLIAIPTYITLRTIYTVWVRDKIRRTDLYSE